MGRPPPSWIRTLILRKKLRSSVWNRERKLSVQSCTCLRGSSDPVLLFLQCDGGAHPPVPGTTTPSHPFIPVSPSHDSYCRFYDRQFFSQPLPFIFWGRLSQTTATHQVMMILEALGSGCFRFLSKVISWAFLLLSLRSVTDDIKQKYHWVNPALNTLRMCLQSNW